MKQYVWNLLIVLDCACDSILFGSSPFETMSSRAWRHRNCRKGRLAVKFIDWLALTFFNQKDHCQKSAQASVFYVGYEVLR